MRYSFLCIVAAVIVTSGGGRAWSGEPVIDVPALMEMPKAEVAKTIGQPDNCQAVKQGESCTYRDGAIKIVFIKGKADWFTLLMSLPFSPAALEQIGFQSEKPDFANEYTIRWSQRVLATLRTPARVASLVKPGETYAEYVSEISLFPGSAGKTHYVLVRGATP